MQQDTAAHQGRCSSGFSRNLVHVIDANGIVAPVQAEMGQAVDTGLSPEGGQDMGKVQTSAPAAAHQAEKPKKEKKHKKEKKEKKDKKDSKVSMVSVQTWEMMGDNGRQLQYFRGTWAAPESKLDVSSCHKNTRRRER